MRKPAPSAATRPVSLADLLCYCRERGVRVDAVAALRRETGRAIGRWANLLASEAVVRLRRGAVPVKAAVES